MIPCPKCETALNEGTRRCPFCGTPMSLIGFRPDPDRKPDPIVDPMLELFTRDEVVVFCPDCRGEFLGGKKACPRCRRATQREVRSRFEAALIARPLRELGDDVASGPREVPRDLVRIKVARGLEEATACLNELRFVGLDPWPGSDSLDPFDDPETIGIYVRAPDRDAAVYLVSGLRPKDPLDRPPTEDPDPRMATLDRARGYLEFGKYADARRALEGLGADPEAMELRTETLLRSGRVRFAEQEAERAAAAAGLAGTVRGRLRAQAGLMKALGHDGTPFGSGADPQAAIPLLALAEEEAPRVLDIGKVHIEVLAYVRDEAGLRASLRRLERLNPNLISRDGWWRDLRESLR
ncbi:MAG: hypothetical protein CMJ83_19085 [Planctomycetes bacterium]|nr:hypothetical protein [Planctomycetota bacterium]